MDKNNDIYAGIDSIFKLDPLNGTHVAAFRAMDEYHRKVADIKTIPTSPADIQFTFPNIRSNPEIPKGTIFFYRKPRPGESLEDRAKSCGKIENIGGSE